MTIQEQTDYKAALAPESTRRNRVNSRLAEITYMPWIPLALFDVILTDNGFQTLEGAIYCGREGQVNEQVGPKSWLTFTWYKMESGKYEIVSYIHG
jgi:hypothetical protein